MSGTETLAGITLRGRYQLNTERVEASSGASASGSRQFSATDLATGETVGVRLAELSRLVEPALGSSSERDALEAHERQCETAMSLRHPTIEKVLDHGEVTVGGTRMVFTVAEPLEGGSLREFIDRGRRLTPSQALVVAIDVCRALDAATKQGIVHGDLRPGRLVFGMDRRVRVVGFGAPLRPVSALTVEQANYAAPELSSGIERSASSDVYSLALTLVEAMTGEVPFASDSVAGAFAARADRLLPVSADFGALAQVLERAARPDPGERFSPRECGQALVKAAEQMPRPTPVEIVTAPVRDASGAISAPIPVPGSAPRSTKPAPPPVAFSPPRAEPGAPIMIRTGPSSATVDPSVPEGVSVARDDTPTGPLRLGMEGTGPVVLDLDELQALTANDPTSQTPAPKKSRWGLRFAVLGLVLAVLGGGGVIAYNTVLNPSDPVPALTGLTEGEARNEIAQYGWGVVILKERSDDVETGEVIRTDPVSGESLKRRESITLYISEGPTFSTLEDVSGKTSDEARAALEELGLEVTVTEANDETVPVGTVVSWEVPDQPTLVAGDQLVKGSTVNIVVSIGPAQRPVPTLVGMTTEQATAALAGVGLTIVVGPTQPHPSVARGLVAVQLPIATTMVDKGSAVTVTISGGQVPTQIPFIYGKDFATVSRRLTEAGLVVGTVTGNQSRGLSRASIGGAQVRYRQRVFKGSVVDLVFP